MTDLRREPAGVWRGAVRLPTGEAATVRARRVLVAAGSATADLLPEGVRLERRLDTRLSRMLVIRGDLPRTAAIVPARSSGGLFFASRESAGNAGTDERVWLVSDGFSSRGDIDPGDLTSAWWTCSIVERLAEFVDPDALEQAEVGAYLAPKSRMRSSPTRVPAEGFAADRTAGLVALTPSKWSAAPTGAIHAVAALLPDRADPADRLAGLGRLFLAPPTLATAPFTETWQHVDR